MKHRMAYETLHKCTDSTAQGHRPSTDTAWRRTVPRPSRGSSPAPGAPMGATASKAGAGALASSRTSATKRVFDRGADPREALRAVRASTESDSPPTHSREDGQADEQHAPGADAPLQDGPGVTRSASRYVPHDLDTDSRDASLDQRVASVMAGIREEVVPMMDQARYEAGLERKRRMREERALRLRGTVDGPVLMEAMRLLAAHRGDRRVEGGRALKPVAVEGPLAKEVDRLSAELGVDRGALASLARHYSVPVEAADRNRELKRLLGVDVGMREESRKDTLADKIGWGIALPPRPR